MPSVCEERRERRAEHSTSSATQTTSFSPFFSLGQPEHANKIHNLLNYRKIWNWASERVQKWAEKAKEFVEIVENVISLFRLQLQKHLKIACFSLSVFAFHICELWSSIGYSVTCHSVPAAPFAHFTIFTIFLLLSFHLSRLRRLCYRIGAYRFIGRRYLLFIWIFDGRMQATASIDRLVFPSKFVETMWKVKRKIPIFIRDSRIKSQHGTSHIRCLMDLLMRQTFAEVNWTLLCCNFTIAFSLRSHAFGWQIPLRLSTAEKHFGLAFGKME